MTDVSRKEGRRRNFLSPFLLFLSLSSAFREGKTNLAEFFTRRYRASNPNAPHDQRIVRRARIFPRDLSGSALSRGYICLSCEKKTGRRKMRARTGAEGISLNCLIYICPNHQSPDFSFRPSSTSVSPSSLLAASTLPSPPLSQTRRGRVRDGTGVINYRVSKPRRAFICTALALSLAPFLILALVMSDATRASSSGNVVVRGVGGYRVNSDKFARGRDRQQYGTILLTICFPRRGD